MRNPSELAARNPEAPRAVAAGSAARSWAQPALDCAFLGVAVVVSLVVYVWSLGLYLDDYAILWRMSASDDHSLFGLYDAVRPGTGQRPLQAGLFAFLYRLFGLHPLGYHLFNAALLVSIAVLLYLVLRELRMPRAICVAVPLVYSMLPHYASERFWLNAFQISLSTAFYLLSLYAALRAVRASRWGFGGWLAIAVVGIAGSLLSYEIAFPLFALNLALVWWASRQSDDATVDRTRVTAMIAVLAVGMVAVGLLKTAAVATHGQNGYGIGFHGGVAHHYAYLGWGAFKVNFGTYFAAFPYVLWWIFSHQFSAANAGVAAAVGSLAFVYIWPLTRAEHTVRATGGVWRALVGGGLVAMVLGYSTFLAASTFLFRSAGIDNRINAAAALGVASALVGGIVWVAQRVVPRYGDVVFAVGVALVVSAGVLVIQTLGTFWTQATAKQHTVMAAILTESRSIPAGGTFILDGACPEVGPTPVFADDADLVAALKIKLGERAPARADVASDGLRASDGRLHVTLRYADHSDTRTYSLKEDLVVFDYASRRISRLATEAQARSYIVRRHSSSCPPLRSFAWGFDPGQRWSPA